MVGGSAESKQEEVIRKMLDELDSDLDSEFEDSDDQEESASQEEVIPNYQEIATCSKDLENNQTQKKESLAQKLVISQHVLLNQEDSKIQCIGGSDIVKTPESGENSNCKNNTATEDALINTDRNWYKEIKNQYEEGKLKLCRSRPMDAKVMDLLEAKSIQLR